MKKRELRKKGGFYEPEKNDFFTKVPESEK
jgi:hypothetical protein